MRTMGAKMSRVTSTDAVAVRPLALRATATSMLVPSLRGTVVAKEPPDTLAATPLTDTMDTPSDTEPETATWASAVRRSGAGAWISTARSDESSWKATDPEPRLPTRSRTVARSATGPSARSESGRQRAPPSRAVQSAARGAPLAASARLARSIPPGSSRLSSTAGRRSSTKLPAAGAVTATDGGVASRITATAAATGLPATSAAETGIVLAPEVSIHGQVKAPPANGAGTEPHTAPATPDSESVTMPVTVRSGAENRAPRVGEAICTSGGVLSRLTVTLAVAELPAWSVAVPETVWPSPSVVTVTGSGQVAMPLPVSLQRKVTVTSVLFQPAALGAGEAVAWMAGGWLSPLPGTSSTRRN